MSFRKEAADLLFSSIEFLFYFLPVAAIVYFLVPENWRNGWLLLVSLFFYGWGEPKYLALMVFSIAVFFLLGLWIEKCPAPKGRKALLILSVALGLGLLGLFKYADFALENVNVLLNTALPLPRLALPIGISFYTFQILSYIIDVYRGRVSAQRSIVSFGCYVSFFPQLIAGPIVRYIDIDAQLKQRHTSTDDFRLGLRRFLVGLGKKILIANQLGELTELFRNSEDSSVLFCWLYAVAFALHIYFDFSGYSDMAIGLGRIFGFHFPENFDHPYISLSVQEFWRRWHMTLGGWFRDYLYIPLGGNRVSKVKWLRNVLFVWLFTGLWHGAAWNFVIWGLMFAGLLLMEKWIPGLKQLPSLLRRGYVLLSILISFVIFNASSMAQAGHDLAGMFGLAGLPLVSRQAIYYLRSYGLIFILAILGSTPIVRNFANRIPARVLHILEPLAMAGLLMLCTAYLVDGSFNPFLYFRF